MALSPVNPVDPALPTPRTAFVLGGGGNLGGYEAGMLRGLFEAGIRPDLIVGTSVGSIHGAVAAADPTTSACATLADLWTEFVAKHVMHVNAARSLATLAQDRTHLASNEGLRDLLVGHLGADRRIEDLPVRFECVASSIERAAARYFDRGPLIPALLASSAVPGLWPAVEIDGEHHYDGGLVESIPVRRALELGAETVYVLHVGRIEKKLEPPRHLWEVASVAFEISRRHCFTDALANLPANVTVHVLPSGEPADAPHHHKSLLNGSRQELETIRQRIDRGYTATRKYLREQGLAAMASGPAASSASASNAVAGS